MKKVHGILSKATKDNAGMALVVSLAIVVLITAAVLAFFARATANRLTEASRANLVKAQTLTKRPGLYCLPIPPGNFHKHQLYQHASKGGNDYKPISAGNAVPQRGLAVSTITDD